MAHQRINIFGSTGSQPLPDPVQTNATDPKVTLFAAGFAAGITTTLLIVDNRQKSSDIPLRVLVNIVGVQPISHGDGLANHDAGRFCSRLEAEVKIVKK